MSYQPRTYRQQVQPAGLVTFRVCVAETDLYLSARSDLSEATRPLVKQLRNELTEHISQYPQFATSLSPLTEPPGVPPLLQAMYRAAEIVRVGPMAAVAGALAQALGETLSAQSDELIIENGGDIYLTGHQPRRVALQAGNSPLSGRLAILLPGGEALGICTSSGTVGHALSLGKADAAVIISPDAAVADAAATALGNLVQGTADIEPALAWARQLPEIRQALIIVGDRLGVWGEYELGPLAG
jgi:ApbE superfamily uncharacterized protein (UPF0280 family)